MNDNTLHSIASVAKELGITRQNLWSKVRHSPHLVREMHRLWIPNDYYKELMAELTKPLNSITVKQASEVLNRSEYSIRRDCRAGFIKATLLPSKTYAIPQEEIERILELQKDCKPIYRIKRSN